MYIAEMLTGKPLFPGKNVAHQLDLVTDLLGTPAAESIARACSFFLSFSFDNKGILSARAVSFNFL